MAFRYGVLPSEFLKISADEFQFNMYVTRIGIENDFKLAQKANKKRSR